MRVLTRIVLSSCLLACGSGGSDPGGTTSSSGASSSGAGSSSGGPSGSSGGSSGEPSQCDAICSTGAFLAFEESNVGGRLEGATVETCLRDICARGVVAKKDGGAGYSLPLLPTSDAGGPQISGDILTPPGDVLRFRISWEFGYGTTAGVTDGDTYTVTARVGDGPLLFEKSYTATYQDQKVCGSTCKVFDVKP